jgi:RNA polymerase sigma factor (TIGR02999 family)
MTPPTRKTTTAVLKAISAGDREAVDELMPLVYEDFHRLAESFLRREREGHTLQPTALVNEAFLKLVDQKQVDWKGRTHFLAIGAQAMRRVLVDHARRRRRSKRGGEVQRIALEADLAVSPSREEDVLAVNEALDKLEELDPRQARIVEYRFFGGLNVEEVTEVLGVSKRTVEADWTMVRAWLRRELSAEEDRGS